MRETLRVRQVLAQTKVADDSFTQLVASMGMPRASSTGRCKVGTAGTRPRSTPKVRGKVAKRFQVDSSESEGDKSGNGSSGSASHGSYRSY